MRELEDDPGPGCAHGWGYVEGENVPDVIGLGAPVNLNGEILALVVSGPVHPMKGEIEPHGWARVEACRRRDPGKDRGAR